MRLPNPLGRLPWLALAVVALLFAMWSGLLRWGWQLPRLQPVFLVAHGPLMVSGFLGTLIALERAVVLNQRWMYLAPLWSGFGSLALIASSSRPAGPPLITLGSVVLVLVFAVIISRQAAPFTLVMGLGALVWLVGNLLWLTGTPLFHVVLWWSGFLVLTIAGERLELSRLRRLSPFGQAVFGVSAVLLVTGLILSVIEYEDGVRLVGLTLLALALWLLQYDIARRTVRQHGLTRFIAIALLAGYVWLGVGGVLALLFRGVPAGPRYDAMLHTVYLGFTFSMIFGHAPIIFPAVLGRPITYRPAFYLHLLLLHFSLVMRVSGDLTGGGDVRRWGGLLNVIALLFFLANTLRSLWRGPTQDDNAKSGRPAEK